MKQLFFFLFLFVICGCKPSTEPASSSQVSSIKRTLYLIRHAKSSHADTILSDFDRPLIKKGKMASKVMGQQLMHRGILLDKMLISPAKRCKSTAKRIAKALSFEKDSIVKDTSLYKCKTQQLITTIRQLPPQYKSVAIVAHNPSLIQTANHFQKDTIFTAVPTAGIIALEFKADSWQNLGHKQGVFLFFDYPKRHKNQLDDF